MFIRLAEKSDQEAILALYESARQFMAANGNPNQWINGYPGLPQLEADMALGGSYVCQEGDRIVCTFFFWEGEEPTYQKIFDGAWLHSQPYGVVHRITTAPGTKGVASFCLDWCFARCGNIRIDTHQDNLPMQKLLTKNGYQRCGTVYMADGSSRIAFQKSK